MHARARTVCWVSTTRDPPLVPHPPGDVRARPNPTHPATTPLGAGDLSANNVLLMTDASDPRGFHAKVSDFGLVHLVGLGNGQVITETLGTMTHMPREMLMEGKVTPAVDVFRCVWGPPLCW